MNDPRSTTLALEIPEPSTCLIRIRGALDRITAVRLLRVVDARLLLVRHRQSPTRQLLLDLTAVESADAGVLSVLRHVRYGCDQHQVGFGVVGAAHLDARLTLRDRQELTRHSSFPTVDAALGCAQTEPA